MLKKIKRKAINKIIEDNLDYLVGFAYYRLGNRMEAEDVVYDSILRFLEKDTTTLNLESARLYLFRIVYNICMDKIRNNDRQHIPIESIDIQDDENSLLDLAEINRINDSLDSLPTREATIIRMNVIDNLSFVEISGILSIPQSTAKSRYKSGMDKLRKLFINNKMS